MRAARILAPALTALLLLWACNGDGNGGAPIEEEIRLALQSMVLQQTEIPEGLENLGGSFADNAQASSGLGSGPTKEQLDGWGRILGYQNDYQRGDPSSTTAANALSTAATLYNDDSGASDSFSDRVNRAREADWQASHGDLTEFQQEEVSRELPADASFWLHLTGFQQTGPAVTRLVSDDILVFRVGRTWGYLNVVSLAAAGETDRAFLSSQVEQLARTQIEHMRRVLDTGILE